MSKITFYLFIEYNRFEFVMRLRETFSKDNEKHLVDILA